MTPEEKRAKQSKCARDWYLANREKHIAQCRAYQKRRRAELRNQGKVQIVVGGQFGSEAKGLYIEHVAKKFAIHVRTGAQNAGHSVFYKGNKYAMCTIPAGWVNEKATLCIGAGAYIEADLLEKEIQLIMGATGESNMKRLLIDYRAGLHKKEHNEAEEGAGMHQRFGSTAHGCMEAAFSKMRRSFEYQNFSESDVGLLLRDKYEFTFGDVSSFLNEEYDKGAKILIEGTQGTGLDLFHGYYPFVTSRSTVAANWLAETGLSPNLRTEVVMVCRSMPIRVAGNSGPLENEIEWTDLARRINEKREELYKDPIVQPDLLTVFENQCVELASTWGFPSSRPSEWMPEERKEFSNQLVNYHKEAFKRIGDVPTEELKNLFEITTVTKKLRRIADVDFVQLHKAVELNRPTFVVLTFMNYLFPESQMCQNLGMLRKMKCWPEFLQWVVDFEDELKVTVGFVSTNKYNLIPFARAKDYAKS